jgi:hypothetical protein
MGCILPRKVQFAKPAEMIRSAGMKTDLRNAEEFNANVKRKVYDERALTQRVLDSDVQLVLLNLYEQLEIQNTAVRYLIEAVKKIEGELDSR